MIRPLHLLSTAAVAVVVFAVARAALFELPGPREFLVQRAALLVLPPIAILICLVSVVVLGRSAVEAALARAKTPLAIAAVVVAAGLLLLHFNVPKRAVIGVSGERLLAFAQELNLPAGEVLPVGRWVGPFRVQAVGVGADGGLYFQRVDAPRELWTLGYGIAYLPQYSEKSKAPFREKHTWYSHIAGNWYEFRQVET